MLHPQLRGGGRGTALAANKWEKIFLKILKYFSRYNSAVRTAREILPIGVAKFTIDCAGRVLEKKHMAY